VTGIPGLLVPAFFASSSLRTQIRFLAGSNDWLLCVAPVAVATIGKFGGAGPAAEATGAGWREAAAFATAPVLRRPRPEFPQKPSAFFNPSLPLPRR
jgi:Kef-type K+ transport system membrane component KefB